MGLRNGICTDKAKGDLNSLHSPIEESELELVLAFVNMRV